MKEPHQRGGVVVDIPFYFIFTDASGSKRVVPLLNAPEAALCEFTAKAKGLKDAKCVGARYFYVSKTRGKRATAFLREAAEFVKQTRAQYHRSWVTGVGKRYAIAATSRRILKPTHLRSLNELLRERKRNES